MNLLDAIVAAFDPEAGYRRAAWREAYQSQVRSTEGRRGYAAADRGRLSQGRRATFGSADAELAGDLALLRARSRQLTRDNTYVAAGLRNLTAFLVGDGITARAIHPDPKLAAEAQSRWDAWALSPVDGRHDFYGVQKLAVRSMIEGGDDLLQWFSVGGQPDVRVQVLEGDYLAERLNRRLDGGGRIVQGVEYDADGQRVAYHLHADHPGDLLGGLRGSQLVRIEARYVDHVFEALRPGQSRGAPWAHPAMRELADLADIKESLRVKKRIEACLALFRRPSPDAGMLADLGEKTAQAEGPEWEKLAPGMILKGKPGEEAPTVINPSASGGDDALLRNSAKAIAAAWGLPFHLMTGDVSDANYTTLRAEMVAFYQRLDDWTHNTVTPFVCNPAFSRVMRREALASGLSRLDEVRAEWTPPPRPWVDPLKDQAAELMELRTIPGQLPKAMAERGVDWRVALQLQKDVNDLIDKLGVALDSDPRRLNGSGALQPAAGYLLPKDDPANAA